MLSRDWWRSHAKPDDDGVWRVKRGIPWCIFSCPEACLKDLVLLIPTCPAEQLREVLDQLDWIESVALDEDDFETVSLLRRKRRLIEEYLR